ncbi:MAG TPA: sugar phosphate isomerase/epimerase family protein [Candidatus Cybelea sp.]|jgi:sugar phosphate isomerase/epimerase|nr:sugar phosphate isomerase/epimerase family protein [Candidatus Cybelea sp.]
MQSYRFGFSEFTTWPWPFKRDVERYRAHGADSIEICEFKLPHNDYGAYLEKLDGLTPASVQMDVHSVFVDSMANKPQDPNDRVNTMKEGIALTAPYLPQGTPFIVITGVAPDANFRKARDRVVESLKELGDFAARHQMKIAFEPLSPANVNTDTAVWSLEDGLELVERADNPNVGICIDTWNVWQGRDVEPLIAQCGALIFVVQLSDWRTPRSTADRYTLGEGQIPLASLVGAIRKTGYSGAWIVEILSSMHLEGSLWKGDLDALLTANRDAFARIWESSM